MISRMALITLALFCTQVAPGNDPLPHSYLEKIEGTPDFCQGDHRFGKLPGDGDELCAPTALSNSIVWLSNHGFPKLLANHGPTLADQAELIRQLCQAEYLDTSLQNGTPPKHVITGIEKFFKSKGYDCQVEQMGWRSSSHRIGKVPEETWMLKSCMGSSSLLLNVGWYTLNKNTYTRHSGHWVTLVGFKKEHGRPILYVHDPSKLAGIEKKTENCHLIPIAGHHLLGTEKGESISGDGFFELKGIHLKRGTDLAIIDDAVAFTPVVAER